LRQLNILKKKHFRNNISNKSGTVWGDR